MTTDKTGFISHYYIVNSRCNIHPDYPINEDKILEIAHNLESWGEKVIVYKITFMFDPVDTNNTDAKITERKEIYRTKGFELEAEERGAQK